MLQNWRFVANTIFFFLNRGIRMVPWNFMGNNYIYMCMFPYNIIGIGHFLVEIEFFFHFFPAICNKKGRDEVEKKILKFGVLIWGPNILWLTYTWVCLTSILVWARSCISWWSYTQKFVNFWLFLSKNAERGSKKNF